MCLCGNLGLLKESGQYSTLAPTTPIMMARMCATKEYFLSAYTFYETMTHRNMLYYQCGWWNEEQTYQH